MAEPTAGMQWLRDFRLSGFALTILLLVVAALVMLAPQLKTLVEQRQQIAQLEREVAAASEHLEQIDSEVARWSDPAYIEAQARDRLFYVYPGDTSYLVLGGDTSPIVPGDDLPVTDSVQTESVDWIDALLSSVYTAGLTTSPAPGDTPVVDSPAQEGSG
jgi:cell division protein FtsB